MHPFRNALVLLILSSCLHQIMRAEAADSTAHRPRVFITTDININKGDPDDRQSLAHLMWYLDQVELRGIAIDRPDAEGVEASHQVLKAYHEDMNTPGTQFKQLGFPSAESMREKLFAGQEIAARALIKEAHRDDPRPLWVLAWGNVLTLRHALRLDPGIAEDLRVISVGTHLRDHLSQGDGSLENWNGPGRAEIFERFPKLWWLEMDWTINAMFEGKESTRMRELLEQRGGQLGRHIGDVIKTVDWADNFRVGDTPSLLYLIDPDNDLDDPGKGSWAGRSIRPFPLERPQYWTDDDRGLGWNYADPRKTWKMAAQMREACMQTLLERRPAMYSALLAKIELLYPGEQNCQ